MKVHVSLVDGRLARDVEIDACGDARVADVTGGNGVVVDGRWVGGDAPLAAAGLYEGAMVAVADGPDFEGNRLAAHTGRVVAGVGGVASGRTFALTGDVGIGRGPSCDIVLDDPAVSPRHARVTRNGAVVDLGSTNGTWTDDDLIHIGATQLRVRTVDDRDRPSARRAGVTTPFTRPPRQPPPVPPEEPPSAPAARSFGAAMVLGPLFMAGAMVAIYGDPRFAVFAALSPVTAGIAWITTKGSSWRAHRWYQRERASFERELDRHVCDPAE